MNEHVLIRLYLQLLVQRAGSLVITTPTLTLSRKLNTRNQSRTLPRASHHRYQLRRHTAAPTLQSRHEDTKNHNRGRKPRAKSCVGTSPDDCSAGISGWMSPREKICRRAKSSGLSLQELNWLFTATAGEKSIHAPGSRRQRIHSETDQSPVFFAMRLSMETILLQSNLLIFSPIELN